MIFVAIGPQIILADRKMHAMPVLSVPRGVLLVGYNYELRVIKIPRTNMLGLVLTST